MHEFEHLQGIPFIHWRVSEGEIEIKEDTSDVDNLKVTIDYYKNRLRDTRRSQPDLFEMFDIPMINKDYDNIYQDRLQLDYELRNKRSVNFEDIMLIDIEKGIRKDLKLKLRKEENHRQSV